MLESYTDIRVRISEEPKWHDENGVPRYETFHPRQCPDVYADQAVLFEIACQQCDAKYSVARTWSRVTNRGCLRMDNLVRDKRLHYGDPPCWACPSGASMTSWSLRVIQFWTRENPPRDWRRVPDLEGLELEDANYKERADE